MIGPLHTLRWNSWLFRLNSNFLPVGFGRNVRNKSVNRALHNSTSSPYDLKDGIEPDQTERKRSPEPTDYENPQLTEDNTSHRKAEDRLPSNSADDISKVPQRVEGG
jgi:hypothetical protein